ncbi:MAG: DUF2179 domain-containing protein [Bacteroidia bacterium]|nr:DUF2179 domain-containing protein [Bacteroidia bacterium]
MDYNTLYNWILFPLLIFVSRTCDVSLGTLRSVLSHRGKKEIVPFIGFVEVLLWLAAISSIMKNLSNVMCYLGWACGYATGIYLGLVIEEKLALGTQVLRIIAPIDCVENFTDKLKKNGFGYTLIDAHGARDQVKLIFAITDRKKVKNVISIINQTLPNAFYSIEDVKHATPTNYTGQAKGKRGLLSMIK